MSPRGGNRFCLTILLLIWLGTWSSVGLTFWFVLIELRFIFAVAIVWLVASSVIFTIGFGFNDVCAGARDWLYCWLQISILGVLLFTAVTRCSRRSCLTFGFRARRWILRLHYFFFVNCQRCGLARHARRNPAERPLVEVSVSVRLVSGQVVISGLRLLSRDHVADIREATEQQLGIENAGFRCHLVAGAAAGATPLLADDARLCDAGIEDGAEITAVIVGDAVDGLVDASGVENHGDNEPLGPLPRVFVAAWFLAWTSIEVVIIVAIETLCLNCAPGVWTLERTENVTESAAPI